jgi:hypothetical protein
VYDPICCIISNFEKFSLISSNDIVSTNEPVLILKNIDQCDVKHILMLPVAIKTVVLDIHYHEYHSSSCRTCCNAVLMFIIELSVPESTGIWKVLSICCPTLCLILYVVLFYKFIRKRRLLKCILLNTK